MKLITAKCPSCGSNLELNKDEEKTVCEYCKTTILVDDAIACYRLKLTGSVSIDGIQSDSELISTANELLSMHEYLKAKKKFLEFSEKYPNDYQGWLGLLICRTRNFTIRDNNVLFENDIKRYREHFFKTAPDNIKNSYKDIIEEYFKPKVVPEVKDTNNQNDTEGVVGCIITIVVFVLFFIVFFNIFS